MRYTIKQGQHYARPLELIKKLFAIGFSRSIDAKVKFGESCRYDVGTDQSDINKLFGISFGYHHRNSARVGWRYIPKIGLVELTTYCYARGKRLNEKSLGFIKFNTQYEIKIILVGDSINFVVNNSTRAMEKIPTSGISYPLSIYFGGTHNSPHNMDIELNVNWN